MTARLKRKCSEDRSGEEKRKRKRRESGVRNIRTWREKLKLLRNSTPFSSSFFSLSLSFLSLLLRIPLRFLIISPLLFLFHILPTYISSLFVLSFLFLSFSLSMSFHFLLPFSQYFSIHLHFSLFLLSLLSSFRSIYSPSSFPFYTSPLFSFPDLLPTSFFSPNLSFLCSSPPICPSPLPYPPFLILSSPHLPFNIA